eukprot:TRINITY_DN11204_c0_g1_i1.p1 TRINITY_DN11204_c0_g1~~TRINITY_DN11204_c0_g1_i1.p1  ORF type:complete len:1020 (+),score=437.26 TRINITY_DN11204_c0_g1_i1:135-3062(+)
MRDVKLNAAAIRELIPLPPSLELSHASCDNLAVKIPNLSLRKFDEIRIVLSLGTLNLSLTEPDELLPLRPKSAKKPSDESESAKTNKLLDHLTVEVTQLNFSFKTKNKPAVRFSLSNLVFQSTGPVRSELTVQYVDKDVICDCFYAFIEKGDTTPKIIILPEIPLVVKMEFKRDRKTKKWTGLKIKSNVEDLVFSWDEESWKDISSLGFDLKRCLNRKHQKVANKPDQNGDADEIVEAVEATLDGFSSFEIEAELGVKKLQVDLKRGLPSPKPDYSFITTGILLHCSPHNKSLGADGKTVNSEMKFELKAKGFNLNAVYNDNLGLKNPVVSMIKGVSQSNIVQLSAVHKWTGKHLSEALSGNTSIQIKADSPVVFLERKIWEGLDNFVRAINPYANRMDIHDVKNRTNLGDAAKKIWANIKKKTNFSLAHWFNSSSLNLTVISPFVTLTNSPQGDGHKFDLSADKITIRNPRLNRLPNLTDGLRLLENSIFLKAEAEFDANKAGIKRSMFDSQLEIDGLKIQHVDSTILKPLSLSFNLRLVTNKGLVSGTQGQLTPIQIHLSGYIPEIVFSMTEKQDKEAKVVYKQLKKWEESRLKKLNADKKHNLSLIQGTPTSSELDVEEAQIEESIKTAKDVVPLLIEELSNKSETKNIYDILRFAEKRDVARAIEASLMAFSFCGSVIFESGSFVGPIHRICEMEKFGDENDKFLFALDKNQIPSASFSGLNIGFESVPGLQQARINLRSVEASHLDHPKSPVVVGVKPSTKDQGTNNISIGFKRRGFDLEKEFATDGESHVDVKLSHMCPSLVIKEDYEGKSNPEVVLSQLKAFVKKYNSASATQESKTTKRYLGFSTGVDVNLCGIEVHDARKSVVGNGKPKKGFSMSLGAAGGASGGAVASEKLGQLESELMQSKLLVANYENEKSEASQKLSGLELELQKMKSQMKDIEEQLILTKMMLVETQLENEELQQLRRGKK